eukprot:CAMPEP_0171327252 /NCGR_PEP_ID=MMETSP0816-20121228/117966_1 /TAXON_ID=420281 /ORGANISM="Proboscia inermis, Strain CCAP1064/1" /LENGTH=52 /DNA_ID=CAMNT_0011826929 /DNA_START=749 /DNA_END=904 /DNA_ORIENTATION=+
MILVATIKVLMKDTVQDETAQMFWAMENSNGNILLYLACEENHVECVMLLEG